MIRIDDIRKRIETAEGVVLYDLFSHYEPEQIRHTYSYYLIWKKNEEKKNDKPTRRPNNSTKRAIADSKI